MTAGTRQDLQRSATASKARAWAVWAGGPGGLDAALRGGIGAVLRRAAGAWYERWASHEGLHLRLYDLPGGEPTAVELRQAVEEADTGAESFTLLPVPPSWQRAVERRDVQPLAAPDLADRWGGGSAWRRAREFFAVCSQASLAALAQMPRGAERVSFGLLVCERLLEELAGEEERAAVLERLCAAALGDAGDAESVRGRLDHEAEQLGGPLRAMASGLESAPWAGEVLGTLAAAIGPALAGASPAARPDLLRRHLHGTLNRLGVLPLEEALLARLLGPTSAVLRVRRLSKAYGEESALDAVDLHVQPGEVFGLLGPPGSGKTTLLGVVCGLRVPDAGRVEVDGQEPVRAPDAVATIVGRAPADQDLGPGATPRETLAAFARVVDGARPVDDVLAEVGLVEVAGQAVAELEPGPRRRLALGCAVLNDPELLVLDEPTNDLGPAEREEVWDLLRSRPAARAVLLATANPREALELCDRVAVIRDGRVVATGDPRRLVDEHFPEQICRFETEEEPDRARLEDIPEARAVRVEPQPGFWIVEAVTRRPDALVALVEEDPELPRVSRRLEAAQPL